MVLVRGMMVVLMLMVIVNWVVVVVVWSRRSRIRQAATVLRSIERIAMLLNVQLV